MTSIILPNQRSAGRRGFEIVLPSEDSDGKLSVVEVHFPAGTAGPPVHRHAASHETYFVLGGTLLMSVDGEAIDIETGGMAHITSGTEHTYATRPGIPAHFLTLHVPGGYERYHVLAMEAEKERGRPLTEADLFALAAQFDWQLAGSEPFRLLPNGKLSKARLADDEAAKIVAEALGQPAEAAH